MNKAEAKSQELEERLIRLSVLTIKAVQYDKSIPQSIRNQLIKSITSIGANYLEANNASSKADFKHKLFICKKEAGESIYWIKIIRQLHNNFEYLSEVYAETTEIIKIFQKAINTMNNGSSNEK